MTTANITRELTFEDMSVHSPGAFRKGDAMRQLRTAPTASAFREALKELDQTANSLDALVEGAKEKALGNSEADLDRIKNNVKRLKFGTIELGTEAAFLRSVLESRPLPSARAPPRESAEFKAASAEIKLLKDRNDAEAKEVAKLVQEVGQSAVAFQQMRDALATRVVQLDELESAAEAAEMAASGADADAARGARDHPADSLLSLEEARAAIEALDAEAKAVRGALKTRTAEVEAMRASLAPAEARLAATRAELGLFAGADSVARKEADAAAAIAETEATVVEQRAMVEHLTGCEIVEVKPDAGDLTMRVRTQIPRCPEAALEPVDGTRAARARAAAGGSTVPGDPPRRRRTRWWYRSTAGAQLCARCVWTRRTRPSRTSSPMRSPPGATPALLFLRWRATSRRAWRRRRCAPGARARGGADAHGVVARLRAGQSGALPRYRGGRGRGRAPGMAAQRRARTGYGPRRPGADGCGCRRAERRPRGVRVGGGGAARD